MSAPRPYPQTVRAAYVEVNRRALLWLLDRMAPDSPFIDTKLNSITLDDYTDQDGLRGPAYLYGWIQGRGLEALATHAAYFERSDPALAARLDDTAKPLYAALGILFQRNGHAAFCCDSELRPVCCGADGPPPPQRHKPGLRTYSDIFVAKGLIAAAARYAPADLPRHLALLDDIVEAIEGRRFVISEAGHIDEDALAAQAEDYGPRMIALGAAALLDRLGLREHDGFSRRFIDFVLERHFDSETGLLANTPGGDLCNVGHGIEFAGFVLDLLRGTKSDALATAMSRIVAASFGAGFTGPGLCLTVDLRSLKPTSPRCPWWSLPETIRAAALAHERTGSAEMRQIWETAHQAFFTHFWRGDPAIAYQTLAAEGPVDFVPATPDLDPGYHTGLSLLAAIEVADRQAALCVPS